jgi:hypothetical protein
MFHITMDCFEKVYTTKFYLQGKFIKLVDTNVVNQ